MKLGSSRKPISLAMVPSARPRNGKTMLPALSQNATRPDRLAHHFVLWGDVRATRAPPIQRVSARITRHSVGLSGPCKAGHRPLTAIQTDRVPDGQITSCFPKWSVQPLLQKYFPSRPTQISSLSRTVLSHRGAIARRHERGAGCGGRGSVRRCQGMAGRVDTARELTNGTQTNDAFPVEAFGGDGLPR